MNERQSGVSEPQGESQGGPQGERLGERQGEPQAPSRRYPRTFGGLIGSMIVLVAAVVGYYVIQNVLHDEPDGKPVAVDYLSTVRDIQGGGYTVAYPATLPKGWLATDANFTPGDRPAWGLPLLTDSGTFAGIQQEDLSVEDMLATALPNGARKGEDVTIDSKVATTWTSWSDGQRDHAFSTSVGKDTLLVYGSASVADLKTLIGLLTTAPVA
ncbi:DUF4245 domain-containing protein [Nocardioides sp. CER19]|uniref:DUF4245 domain-containing protein n=1 Tax=Nocardioides sp. CER19 TaxID=3038538 RepID=UPI00244B61B5|nr:DUF4245 domain-containing protein [Nocardioides sp. CER19]MDH2414955.1 DUF4245 domain-containing protein [Nocardioides sp. CER19]